MYYMLPDNVRNGNNIEELKTLHESRKELVQKILVRNNEWMKNLSRDEVDEKKSSFKKDLEEPKKISSDDDDVDMEGA